MRWISFINRPFCPLCGRYQRQFLKATLYLCAIHYRITFICIRLRHALKLHFFMIVHRSFQATARRYLAPMTVLRTSLDAKRPSPHRRQHCNGVLAITHGPSASEAISGNSIKPVQAEAAFIVSGSAAPLSWTCFMILGCTSLRQAQNSSGCPDSWQASRMTFCGSGAGPADAGTADAGTAACLDSGWPSPLHAATASRIEIGKTARCKCCPTQRGIQRSIFLHIIHQVAGICQWLLHVPLTEAGTGHLHPSHDRQLVPDGHEPRCLIRLRPASSCWQSRQSFPCRVCSDR